MTADLTYVQWKQVGKLEQLGAEALAIRVLQLESELAALGWRPITPENLPTLGCEVTRRNYVTDRIFKFGKRQVLAVEVLHDFSDWDYGDYVAGGWSHFRPINLEKSGHE